MFDSTQLPRATAGFFGVGIEVGVHSTWHDQTQIFPFPLSALTYPPGYLIFFSRGEKVCSQWAGVNGLQKQSVCNDCMMPMNAFPPTPSLPPSLFFSLLPSFPPSPPLLKPLLTTKVWGTARLRIHTCSTKRSSSLEMWTLTDGTGFQLISVNDTSDAFWNGYLRQY